MTTQSLSTGVSLNLMFQCVYIEYLLGNLSTARYSWRNELSVRASAPTNYSFIKRRARAARISTKPRTVLACDFHVVYARVSRERERDEMGLHSFSRGRRSFIPVYSVVIVLLLLLLMMILTKKKELLFCDAARDSLFKL